MRGIARDEPWAGVPQCDLPKSTKSDRSLLLRVYWLLRIDVPGAHGEGRSGKPDATYPSTAPVNHLLQSPPVNFLSIPAPKLHPLEMKYGEQEPEHCLSARSKARRSSSRSL